MEENWLEASDTDSSGKKKKKKKPLRSQINQYFEYENLK
jgi:hypothetical protein